MLVQSNSLADTILLKIDDPSSFIESKLEDEDTQEIRALLDDDEYLLSIIPTACGEAQSYAVGLAQCLQVLELARSCTTSQSRIPRHDLYPKALLGELGGSSTVRELLLTMKKMNSTKFLALLDKVLSEVFVPYLQDRLPPLRDEISGLVEDSTKKNLVSEFDLSNVDTLRATVVSRRVQLSEKKSSLTKEEEEYSKLVQQVHDEFEKYFTRNLKGVREVLLHELFFYDLISPHRDVFAPKQRFTIERALSNPQDYLPCECCVDENMDADEIEKARQDGEESTIHATSPPASILYKLYLESGALINIYDLWTAFYAIIGGSNVGDEGEGEGENEDEDDPAEDSGEKNKNKSNEGAIQPKPSKIDKPTAQ